MTLTGKYNVSPRVFAMIELLVKGMIASGKSLSDIAALTGQSEEFIESLS